MNRCILLILLCSCCSRALSAPAADQPRPLVRLVTEHLPPYQLATEGNIEGFATDVVLEAFRRSDVNVIHNAFSWNRSYNLTLKRPNTCIYSIARIPTREDLFSWIGTITETNNAVVWGLKNKDYRDVQSVDDLKNYNTAVIRSDVTHSYLLEKGLVEGRHLYVVDNTESLVKLLFMRPEIDFIVVDDITIGYRAKWADVDTRHLQRIIELEDLPLNFYLACNLQTDKTVQQQLRQSLATIHQDGTYKGILSKWQDHMIKIN